MNDALACHGIDFRHGGLVGGSRGVGFASLDRLVGFLDGAAHAGAHGSVVLAVLFGANMSFATPMAYKTNLLVMNAGGYRFGDFTRVGAPLFVIMWAGLSTLLAWRYGLG